MNHKAKLWQQDRGPRAQTLFAICRVLGVSLDTFLEVDPWETDGIPRKGGSKRRAYGWYMRNYGHRLVENPPKHEWKGKGKCIAYVWCSQQKSCSTLCALSTPSGHDLLSYSRLHYY